jgi:hypothetical protein
MQNVKTLRLIDSQRDLELAIAVAALPRAEFRSAMKKVKRSPRKPAQPPAMGFGRRAA